MNRCRSSPILLLALLLAPVGGLRAQERLDTAAAAPAAGAPVLLGNDTLLVLRRGIGAFTAAERAEAVTARLRRVARDPLARAGEVRRVEDVGTTEIVLGDVVLVALTDADAAAAGVSRDSLAAAVAGSIQAALTEQSFTTRLRVLLLGGLLALFTTLLTVVVFRAVQRIFPRIFAAIEAGRAGGLPALRIQKLELLSAGHVADALLWLARVLRVLLLALILYISIPIILSFFPWTEQLADRLFGYILTPFATLGGAILGYLPNLFTIGAIAIVTWYLLKLIHLFFTGISRGSISFAGFYPEWGEPTYKIVRFFVLAFAFIMVWPYLPGSDSEAFKGVGVVLGLLLSLGSAAAVGNAVGGVVLTYMRPFRIGDRVKIADTVGDVIDKDLLVTRIRTSKNVEITVPNAMVLGSHIINYSAPAEAEGLILNTSVTIGYDAPWRQVHELLIAAARATPGILETPAPFVLQTQLGDFSVTYELNAYTREPNRMLRLYSDLHANIQDRFNEAGVEILSPVFEAQRDGGPPVIPPEYRAVHAGARADAERAGDGASGSAC